MSILSFKLFLGCVGLFLLSIIWWRVWRKRIIARNNEEKEFLPLAYDYETWCEEHSIIIGGILSLGLAFFISLF